MRKIDQIDLYGALLGIPVAGYFFSFIYAVIVDTIQNGGVVSVRWVWKHRYETGVLDYMIHGSILYLTVVIVIATLYIINEIKTIPK